MGIGIPSVGGGDSSQWVHAEASFCMAMPESHLEQAKKNAGEEAPEESGKDEMIRELFLFAKLLVHFVGGSEEA